MLRAIPKGSIGAASSNSIEVEIIDVHVIDWTGNMAPWLLIGVVVSLSVPPLPIRLARGFSFAGLPKTGISRRVLCAQHVEKNVLV